MHGACNIWPWSGGDPPAGPRREPRALPGAALAVGGEWCLRTSLFFLHEQQHLSPVLSSERPGQLARVLKGFSVGRCRFPSEPCEQLARTPVGKTLPSSSGAPDLTDRIKARGSISLCLTKPGKQLKCIWGTEWCQSNSEWMIHPSYQFHCTTGNRRRQTKGKERAE